jgi:hypothetical protein
MVTNGYVFLSLYNDISYAKWIQESLHMLLRSDLVQHQGVPKEYTLDVVSQAVQNTFVFTEQDLPGFKSRSRNKFDPLSANMPPRLNRSKVEKSTEKQPWDKNRRSQPYYRRAIPSRFCCWKVMDAKAHNYFRKNYVSR